MLADRIRRWSIGGGITAVLLLLCAVPLLFILFYGFGRFVDAALMLTPLVIVQILLLKLAQRLVRSRNATSEHADQRRRTG